MNTLKISPLNNPQRSQMKVRIVIGCLGGLILAIAAWGMDAIILSHAHSYLPWIKFALGALITIPLFGLVGFLISRLGAKYLATFICFSIGSVIVAWLAPHLSFDLYNKMIGWVNPGLASRIEFAYDETAQTVFILMALVMIVMSAVLSVFYELLIIQAYMATSKTSVALATLAILVFFLASGLLLDNFNNQDQRPPIIQTAYYLTRAQEIQAGELAYDSRLMKREWVFLSLEKDLNRDYKLARISYDPVIKMNTIYILFDDEWFNCSVAVDQPLFCDITAQVE